MSFDDDIYTRCGVSRGAHPAVILARFHQRQKRVFSRRKRAFSPEVARGAKTVLKTEDNCFDSRCIHNTLYCVAHTTRCEWSVVYTTHCEWSDAYTTHCEWSVAYLKALLRFMRARGMRISARIPTREGEREGQRQRQRERERERDVRR